LIFVGAMFSAHGLSLLSRAAQQAGLPSSFYSVARAAVPQYTILIDLAVALKCFGVATGYLITVGDCMVDALDHILLSDDSDEEPSWWISLVLSRRFWVVGATIGVLPVSFFRTLDELKKASALALIFVFFLAFGIIAYANGLADPCFGNDDYNLDDMNDDVGTCVGEIEKFTDVPRTISKLPIFVFAFTCHQNIFPIVNELQQRTQQRLNLVIVVAIGFALILFTTVALEGYKTFGNNVRGDILLNYPETGNVTVLRICIAFMLALHYPLQLDPSRRCITSLIKVVQQWRQGQLYKVFHNGYDNEESSGLEDIMEDEASVFSGMNSTNHSTRTNSVRGSFRDSVANLAAEQEGKEHLFINETTFYSITIAFLFLSFSVAMMVDDLVRYVRLFSSSCESWMAASVATILAHQKYYLFLF